jgi:hypothetical protein
VHHVSSIVMIEFVPYRSSSRTNNKVDIPTDTLKPENGSEVSHSSKMDWSFYGQVCYGKVLIKWTGL